MTTRTGLRGEKGMGVDARPKNTFRNEAMCNSYFNSEVEKGVTH